jgi:phytoene dehydrogenase-like protein
MPERTIETEIAVVGAGIAGLSAAWTLANQGVDVVVLEARDRVGGREWNVEIGGERTSSAASGWLPTSPPCMRCSRSLRSSSRASARASTSGRTITATMGYGNG